MGSQKLDLSCVAQYDDERIVVIGRFWGGIHVVEEIPKVWEGLRKG